MVVWRGLTIVVKIREVKGKEEKERYIHLNAEFQRIARRDKKGFLSDQCKGIEENNRMGKTRDLFKKIRDTKGTISCKDGLDKGQKWYGPNRSRRYQEEVARIHRRTVWKRSSPDNHNGVITDLEPDILECEVKWALGSITTNKASGGDGIPVELFQILKDDAVKCCTQYASKFGKLSTGHRTGKAQFSFWSQRKAMPKHSQTTTQLYSSHMLVK